MRNATYSKRAVRCPNAMTLGGCKTEAKPGDFLEFTYPDTTGRHIARVIARIDRADDDGEPCNGWLSVLEMSWAGAIAYVRWIDPAWVLEVHADADAMLRWFAQPREEWATMRPEEVNDLDHYGSLSATYVHGAAARLAEYREHHPKPSKPALDPRSERASAKGNR